MRRRSWLLRGVLPLLFLLVTVPAGGSVAGAEGSDDPAHPIIFPVIGEVTYSDTFGHARGGGRTHQGQDLMGPKMLELVAAADGRITYVANGSMSGHMVELTADDGWVYSYIHLNNDTPGTDDGNASPSDTYGPGIEKGATVVAGQLVGYLGDSGNAENSGAHLHFEMKDPNGVVINPWESLRAATHVTSATGSEPSPIPRLAGVDRVATAIEMSRSGWPDGAPEVVVAAGDRYAEALPASVLAAARNGPLLLTTAQTLADPLRAEIERLNPSRVTVVGSVPTPVSDAIAATGRDVARLGVAGDPTATATAVAGAVGGDAGTVVLVNRDRFADGVSATAVAAGRGWPVLLTTSKVIPQVTVDAWRDLGVHTLVLVGGSVVIGDNIETYARSSGRCAGGDGCTVDRLAGPDRYATSVATAERSVALGGRSAATLLLGTGTAYADVLSAGPLASRLGGLPLLVDGTGARHDAASRSFLQANATGSGDVSILGGVGAVTTAADRALQEALGLR